MSTKLQRAARYHGVSRDLHEIAIGLDRNGVVSDAMLEEVALLAVKPAGPMSADEVRQPRVGSNLTQEVFGRALNISKKTVSAWERARRSRPAPRCVPWIW